MMNFRLNNKTKRTISSTLGIDFDTLAKTDIDVIDKQIEERNNVRLKPAINLGGLSPRGSVYLMFERLITREEIDNGLSKIK